MSKEGNKTNRGRLTEIASLLASYGFGHIYRTKFGKKEDQQDAKRLRLAFEELGPTFIKFGQILSTRPDLLPKDYTEELAKLQDNAPPFPFYHIEETFKEDFGQKLADVFEWVEKEPLASASVAQVHRARTLDGQAVIIKVQRPDMEKNLLRDIQLFSRIVAMTPETIKSFIVDADVALAEVEQVTRIELDFRNEANALIRFRLNNTDRDVVYAPKPLLEYTSKRVLVEEYISGINGLNIGKMTEAGYDKEDFVEKFIYSYLSQIFEDGFFHADPHPGNIIIRDGQIVFIDFGIHGEISEENRNKFLDILEAIVIEDIDSLMNLLLQLAIVRADLDRYELYNDLENFFYIYVAKDFRQIDIGRLMRDILSIAQKHNLIMPNDFILLAKSLAIIEGVVEDFDTDINVFNTAKTYLTEKGDYTLLAQIGKKDIGLAAYKTLTSVMDIPVALKKSLETIGKGRARLNVEVMGWDSKSKDVNKMVNRIVFAIIIASLILASAIITVSVTSPGLSRLSVVIFLGAGLMGLWLLISIIRSGTL